MIEPEPVAGADERRITWSLMAVVVAFVVLMTCIVLWITSTLIRDELGGNGQTAGTTPVVPTRTEPPTPTSIWKTLPVRTATAVPGAEAEIDATWTPAMTWTPVGPVRYVRFNRYKVNKSKITLGECIQVTWDTSFAVRLEFYRDRELLLEDAPPGYTFQDCPETTGYVVYRLVAFNAAGESNWIQTQVRVVKPEAP